MGALSNSILSTESLDRTGAVTESLDGTGAVTESLDRAGAIDLVTSLTLHKPIPFLTDSSSCCSSSSSHGTDIDTLSVTPASREGVGVSGDDDDDEGWTAPTCIRSDDRHSVASAPATLPLSSTVPAVNRGTSAGGRQINEAGGSVADEAGGSVAPATQCIGRQCATGDKNDKTEPQSTIRRGSDTYDVNEEVKSLRMSPTVVTLPPPPNNRPRSLIRPRSFEERRQIYMYMREVRLSLLNIYHSYFPFSYVDNMSSDRFIYLERIAHINKYCMLSNTSTSFS